MEEIVQFYIKFNKIFIYSLLIFLLAILFSLYYLIYEEIFLEGGKYL